MGDSPLSESGGRSPPAPAWFTGAVGQAPTRARHMVEGAAIETLSWGPPGAPGVMLLHGHGAHAAWWSFIAPFLADGRRVVAISWSGMGGSDWREAYDVDQYAREAMAVAEAEGFFANAQKPVFVAHSFGGVPLLRLVDAHGARLARAVLIDTLLKPSMGPWKGEKRRREHQVFDSAEALLARFRLSPPRDCDNPFILDWMGRTGAAQVPSPGGGPDGGPNGGTGYRWAFDPNLWDRVTVQDVHEVLGRAACPLAFVAGAESPVVPAAALRFARARSAPGTPIVSIPDCGHHVLADQPLALIAVLQAFMPPPAVTARPAEAARGESARADA